jgi:hypothetical protein
VWWYNCTLYYALCCGTHLCKGGDSHTGLDHPRPTQWAEAVSVCIIMGDNKFRGGMDCLSLTNGMGGWRGGQGFMGDNKVEGSHTELFHLKPTGRGSWRRGPTDLRIN